MVQTVAASCRSLHQLLDKKKTATRSIHVAVFSRPGALRLGVKIELQLRRGFSAGWRVLPILQRIFDRVHQDRVSADDVRFLDPSIRANDHLHLHNAGQAHSLGDLGVSGNRIGECLAAFLRLRIRHAQTQRHRQQRTAQGYSLMLVSHFQLFLWTSVRLFLERLDFPCSGHSWDRLKITGNPLRPHSFHGTGVSPGKLLQRPEGKPVEGSGKPF